MRILVLGAGMYVTGRDGSGPGALLAALCEASRSLPLRVTVAATAADNAVVVAEAAARLNERLGTAVEITYRQLTGALSQSVAALAGEGFDAAIIALPDDLHHAAASAAMQAGLHVLVVKPLTPTLAEARDLEAQAQRLGLHGMVEFHKRFDESNLYARSAIANGLLGQPQYAAVQYSQRLCIPTRIFRGWAARSNIFQYLAVHYIDLIWFLTRYRPRQACAVGVRGILAAQGIDTWDSVHALVRWQTPTGGEFVSQFAVNWIDPDTTSAMSDQRITLVGEGGRLDLDQKHRGVELVRRDQPSQALNPYFAEFLPTADGHDRFSGYGPACVGTFVADVAAITAGTVRAADLRDRRPSFADALASCAVVEAVNHSLAHDGAWTDVADLDP
ncbi:MAG: Gfo/Idh/MocA family oxidoreductase [Magnetospirillum gryphiswaldense]|nr:Gfo/Idh/MocA family oxidoreductase [Magnetospirillum gryphiswaldense]